MSTTASELSSETFYPIFFFSAVVTYFANLKICVFCLSMGLYFSTGVSNFKNGSDWELPMLYNT